MAWNQAPEDLPANAVSILIAIIASCIGYVLFSQRYGEPIRETKAAIARLERGAVKAPAPPSAPESVPAMTDQELAERIELVVADRFNGNQQLIADLNGRIRELEMRVAAAESRPVPSNSSTPIYADGPTHAPAAEPAPTPSGPPRARLVDIHDNVRIELSNPRMMGSRVGFDMAITKLGTTDGYFKAQGTGINDANIITSDGIQLYNMRLSRPDGTRLGMPATNLIAGTPMRFVAVFEKGTAPELPFVCRRVTIIGYSAPRSREPLRFTFEHIPVTR